MSARISEDGMLTVGPSSGRNDYSAFNPAIVASTVATQMGGYLSQLNSYEEAFKNLDMNMLMTREERQAYKFANRYASEVQPKVFSPTYLPQRNMAGWFRPYATFEKVGLRNGPKVENTMYGSYFGGDSSIKELSNGWDYQYSVYIGYNGSHQNYQGNSISQNGGNLGATGIWYKGDFYTALTANVGAGVAEASTMFGHEDFPMLMAGVASKTGYNFELAKGKFIIQPSYLMSYTFVNTFDYTNAAGMRINTDPLHAINIAPGLKFIGNLKNGWQPYAGIQMVWNIMDKTDFHANDVPLPEMSVKPYFQYGLGVQKRWGERFTGFGQFMIRNGGRNGIALSAGFRWAIGKSSKPGSSAKKATGSNKTLIKQTNNTTVTNPISKKPSKIKGFLTKMDGEPIYIVTIHK
jgi:outer membrane autotransporter protein